MASAATTFWLWLWPPRSSRPMKKASAARNARSIAAAGIAPIHAENAIARRPASHRAESAISGRR